MNAQVIVLKNKIKIYWIRKWFPNSVLGNDSPIQITPEQCDICTSTRT